MTQITLFLTPTGQLHAELPALNGSRRPIPLTPGLVESQIREALLTEATRIHETQLAAAAALHSRVWWGTATHHSVGFADRTIGPRVRKSENFFCQPLNRPAVNPSDIGL